MKQGRATREGGGQAFGAKPEPTARVVNVRSVSQIGSAMGNHSTDHGGTLPKYVVSETLYPDKVGFNTPRDRTVQVFGRGSQGRR